MPSLVSAQIVTALCFPYHIVSVHNVLTMYNVRRPSSVVPQLAFSPSPTYPGDDMNIRHRRSYSTFPRQSGVLRDHRRCREEEEGGQM